MHSFTIAEDFLATLRSHPKPPALYEALACATERMGFRYFAAIHHIDFAGQNGAGVRLHNYPPALVARFDAERRGPSDPIHRASHVTATGFCWHDLPQMIDLTRRDEMILDHARQLGLGDGFTKPAHVPGEARGSISFAVETDGALPEDMLFCAQIVGDLAFEAARRSGRRPHKGMQPRITDRQLECILWVGRGKTDREIADLLGVQRSTVIEHLRNARIVWNLKARGVLPIRALVEGALCFSDFFPGPSPLVGMV